MGFTKKITGRKIDFSSMQKFPDVDIMCDVLTVTQQEMGDTPCMKEASYDKSGKKINRFRRCPDGRVVDTRTGEILDLSGERDYPIVDRVDLSYGGKIREVGIPTPVKTDKKEEISSNHTSSSEHHCKKKESLLEMGFDRFYNKVCGYEEDEDDNGEYICEYCNELGYSNKYKAYICDNCSKCEGCSEFLNNTCDGCSYSRVRTGRLYSESLSEDQIVDPDDIETIRESLTLNQTKRKETGKFSTLNY